MLEQMILPVIAKAYERAIDRSGVPGAEYVAWVGLAHHCKRLARKIRTDYLVIETTESRPYATADEMFDDLDHGRLLVSTANTQHPVWSRSDNTEFRVCHDVLGHYIAARLTTGPADFSWDGELAAYQAQASLLPQGELDIERALFTEVVGQAAFALHRGFFGPQKVAFL